MNSHTPLSLVQEGSNAQIWKLFHQDDTCGLMPFTVLPLVCMKTEIIWAMFMYTWRGCASIVCLCNSHRVLLVQIASQRMTIATAVHTILSDGGLAALFRGLGAASVRIVPMAIVSFGTYEVVRSQYMQLEESWSLAAAEKDMKVCAISSKELSCEV